MGHIESYPLEMATFDAAVAWGIMFHLIPEAQVRAIANVSHSLKKGAPFLFTSGDEDGFEPKAGTMNGVTFHYYSFSKANYERILAEQGLTLVDVHRDEGENTYYLASRNH